jgi:hypothetical protein
MISVCAVLPCLEVRTAAGQSPSMFCLAGVAWTDLSCSLCLLQRLRILLR